MSSYEFLELVEQMDDRGRYKTAARGGELCQQDEMLRQLTNEMSKLRATMHAVHGGQKYVPKVFWSTSELREAAQEAEAIGDRREDFFSMADRTEKMMANGSSMQH